MWLYGDAVGMCQQGFGFRVEGPGCGRCRLRVGGASFKRVWASGCSLGIFGVVLLLLPHLVPCGLGFGFRAFRLCILIVVRFRVADLVGSDDLVSGFSAPSFNLM